MSMCQHLNFEADVEVARLLGGAHGVDGFTIGEQPSGPVTDARRDGNGIAYHASVQIRCAECKTRFAFVGVEAGFSFTRPMVSPVGFELRVPILPCAHETSMLGGDPETAFPVHAPTPTPEAG